MITYIIRLLLLLKFSLGFQQINHQFHYQINNQMNLSQNHHWYGSSFFPLLLYINILPRMFEDDTFYLLQQQNLALLVTNKYLHGISSSGISLPWKFVFTLLPYIFICPFIYIFDYHHKQVHYKILYSLNCSFFFYVLMTFLTVYYQWP